MVLIGVLGKKRHGKDTLADYLVSSHRFHKETFAKPLKDACRILFDLTEEQLYGDQKEVMDETWKMTPREILQYVGTDMIRNRMALRLPWLGMDFWLYKFERNYRKLQQEFGDQVDVIISDVRFPNETKMIHRLGGYVVKTFRPGFESADTHTSEAGIDLIDDYDMLIINDGTIDQYHERIDKMMAGIRDRSLMTGSTVTAATKD